MALDFEELFVIAPQWLLFDPDRYPDRVASSLSDGALRLYAVLQSYADRDTQKATPGRPALAKALGCSPKTVDRRVQELIEFGALVRKHRRDEAGDFTSNDWLVRTRPEETLWTTVTRGSVKSDATVATPATPRVGSNLTPKQESVELDPLNQSEAVREVVVDPSDLVDAWASKTGTPLTKPLRRRWYPYAVDFVAAASDDLLRRSDSFLDHCVREGCRSPKGWPYYAAGYSRALRLAGLQGSPTYTRLVPDPDDDEFISPGEARKILGMRDGETGREFLERTAREQAS